MLFLASFLALYFELLVIRYISTEVAVFLSLKNLPLIASFFGLGIGMLRTGQLRRVQRGFALTAAALFLLIRFRAYLPQPALGWQYQLVPGKLPHWLSFAVYVGFVLLMLWLIVLFFAALGDKVGNYLKVMPPLPGYGINLAGSLAGILGFTLLSFSGAPPLVWLAAGFALLLPLWWRRWSQILVLAAVVVATGMPPPGTRWSPYHRIDIQPVTMAGIPRTAAYRLRYNHLWYQTMVDLSPQFMQEHPAAEPNRSVRDYYDLPYRLVSQAASVLVVGAGTGNDVAAALRHGARHVDAVEIDPVILDLGRRYHPEHPYQSPNVTTYVDDARAFFHKAKRKYDLIVFGFLDSSTLLTGFSSLRLDNYVYTRESFASARTLLKPGGSMVLAFAVTRSFAADRLFVTLTQAFDGIEPRAFPISSNVKGMLYIEGAAREHASATKLVEATADLHRSSANAVAASDNWPFLYLQARAIPVSLQVVLALFVLSAWLWQRSRVRTQFDARGAEFFLLGAGFLLLETDGVTRLALLFGSTWIVNVAVISAFLFMALAANALVERVAVNVRACYPALLLLVLLGTALPYFGWSASLLTSKVVLATLWTALPVFFSGLIFSSVLQNTTSPHNALAMNLLGAVIGGVLENAVMIGGSVLVGFLACLVYAMAWRSGAAKGSFHPESSTVAVAGQPES